MSTPEFRNEAKTHLERARSFLRAAENNFALDELIPAGSDAAFAGIRAKDAISVMVNDKTIKARHHQDSIAELEAALDSDPELSTATDAFAEIINAKNDVQYSNKVFERQRISALIDHARYLVDLAAKTLAQG
jgi:uncharacterized protein (UPF0332 family)